MRIRKKNNNSISQNEILSIQLSLGGFCFCISDSETKEATSYYQYDFEAPIRNPEKLLEKIKYIFSENTKLQRDFDKVVVIHTNHLSTLVPNEYFDENDLKKYLTYSVKTLTNDYFTFDDLIEMNTKNVYIPFVNINNYLFQNFGEFEYKHHTSVLIDKLLSYSKRHTETLFFVNVTPSTIDIVVTKGNSLILSNSFEYVSKEDFIYYILFTAEQLSLNPETFNLLLMGAIDKSSENYQITYEYVRNIDFITIKSSLFMNSTDLHPHTNYILVS